jgi:hypothetical protein
MPDRDLAADLLVELDELDHVGLAPVPVPTAETVSRLRSCPERVRRFDWDAVDDPTIRNFAREALAQADDALSQPDSPLAHRRQLRIAVGALPISTRIVISATSRFP